MLKLLISCWDDGVCRSMSLHVCDGFRCCVSPPPAVLCLSVYCLV